MSILIHKNIRIAVKAIPRFLNFFNNRVFTFQSPLFICNGMCSQTDLLVQYKTNVIFNSFNRSVNGTYVLCKPRKLLIQKIF